MDAGAEKDSIMVFVERGNFHAAMNITISALNECRKNKDQSGVNFFLDVVSEISDTMKNTFGDK